MVKAKESRDTREKKKRKKTSRDREFLEDLWGDFAESRRVHRGHRGLQNTLKLFSAPMPFEGATAQILTKKGRGRAGQTNIWAPLVPITRRSLGLRSQVHMGTGGQGYGAGPSHMIMAPLAAPFSPEHAGFKNGGDAMKNG